MYQQLYFRAASLVLNETIGHICSQICFCPYWEQAWSSHTLHYSAAAGGRMVQARSSEIDTCWYLLSFQSFFLGPVLSQFNHFLILWTALLQWIGGWHFLLLLVGGWLRLGTLWSVVADAVVHQNSSQEPNNKCDSTGDHSCNPHSSTYAEGLHNIYCKREE